MWIRPRGAQRGRRAAGFGLPAYRGRRNRWGGSFARAGAVLAVLAAAALYSGTEGGPRWQLGTTQAKQIVGYARVLDGDTIEIAGTRIRLHGIDAAEGNQRCGRADGGTWDCAHAASERLRALMANREATCDAVDRDRYGRVVAACRVGDVDVQEVLAREGLAWAYRQYSSAYVPAEQAARAEGRGIWQGPAEPPWDWRQRQPSRPPVVSSQSAPSGCVIKGNINSKGERIYHTPASPWYNQTTVNTSRGQRWFCSEAEARAAGWRPARR